MSKINVETIAQALNNPNFSFIDSFADAADSSKVTREMTLLLFKHRELRDLLKRYERERVIIEKDLRKEKQQAYLRHKSAINEKHRSILVDIDTEEKTYELAIIDQKIKETNRMLTAIKLELDTWKSISYSLRTEMGSF